MSAATANVLITKACSVPLRGIALAFKPGKALVPEAIADRIVNAGCGSRIHPRGQRLAAAMKGKANEAE